MSLDTAEELFDNEKYAEARDEAEKALKTADAATTKQLQLLIRKCNLHVAPAPSPASASAPAAAASAAAAAPAAAAAAAPAPAPVAAAPPKPAPLARHEWYQTGTHLTFTFYVKQRTAADVKATATARSLSVSIRLDDGRDAQWLFEPFYMEVDAASVETACTPYKVEMKLAKAHPGQWASLELKAMVGAASAAAPVVVAAPVDVLPRSAKELNYPTSSAKRTDWSKVTLDEDKEDKAAGEEALSHLFKKIYANADEDTRRAMIKSYQESGGTTLSTNWKDIGSRYVAPSAPNGMEVRHYTSEAERLQAEAAKNPKKDEFS